MRIGVFGRHPIPQPGFMGVMSLFEAVYLSRQGHKVDLILPFSDETTLECFKIGHRLTDLNELEKLNGSFEIIPLLTGGRLAGHYDCIIYQSYEFSDFATYFPILRAAATIITKNFPKFVPSAKLALHETVESSFKTFDLVACALQDDIADLRMNQECWDKYGAQVAYVPRGADPVLLHPGRKLGGRPTIGLEIPIRRDSLPAVEFYIEPLRMLKSQIPDLRIITIGDLPHPEIDSEHVFFGQFDTIYEKFFNEIWLYLVMDYRKSPLHVAAPVQQLNSRWAARAIYEVQNIEAQMSGAIIIGHPDNIIAELLQPGQSALYIDDYKNAAQIARQMKAALDNFPVLSPKARTWAASFTWEHCMERWSSAMLRALDLARWASSATSISSHISHGGVTPQDANAPTKRSLSIPARMTDRDMAILASHAQGKNSCIQFGSGGSTLLLCSAVSGRLVSIEIDKECIERLKLENSICKNIEMGRLTLVHIDIGSVGEWGYPETDTSIRLWPQYYSRCWQILGSQHDLIFIDGRFRVMCALAALNFVSTSGIVALHDYGYRHHYTDVMKYYEEIERGDEILICTPRNKIDRPALFMDMIAHVHDAS